jgi:hypothetical protein
MYVVTTMTVVSFRCTDNVLFKSTVGIAGCIAANTRTPHCLLLAANNNSCPRNRLGHYFAPQEVFVTARLTGIWNLFVGPGQGGLFPRKHRPFGVGNMCAGAGRNQNGNRTRIFLGGDRGELSRAWTNSSGAVDLKRIYLSALEKPALSSDLII